MNFLLACRIQNRYLLIHKHHATSVSLANGMAWLARPVMPSFAMLFAPQSHTMALAAPDLDGVGWPVLRCRAWPPRR